MVGVIVILPVLLMIFIGVGRSAVLLRRHTRSQSICDGQIFALQDRLATRLNQLFKLNPRALKLRVALTAAQARLAAAVAAGNAPAILAFNAQIAKIQIQKIQLGAQQKSILAATRFDTAATKVRTRTTLAEDRPKIEIREIQVRGDIAGDTAPLYQTLEPFSQLQISRVHLAQSTGCAATIESRAGFFRARLEKNEP